MMMQVHRPPTRIVATTLANNDAMLRCDLRDFMPDLPKKINACDTGGQQLIVVALYVVRGKVVVW